MNQWKHFFTGKYNTGQHGMTVSECARNLELAIQVFQFKKNLPVLWIQPEEKLLIKFSLWVCCFTGVIGMDSLASMEKAEMDMIQDKQNNQTFCLLNKIK